MLIFNKKSASNNSWFVRASEKGPEYRASFTNIQANLEGLMKIRRYQEVTSHKEKFSSFEVDESGLKVSFYKDNADKPILSIYLGKSGKNFNSTLVRLDSENTVYSAKGNLKNDWDKELDHFRNKSLLDLVPENIDSYTLSGAYQYSISKNKLQEWEITGGRNPIPALAKQDKVKEILRKICDLKANSFHGSEKQTYKKYANISLLLADKSTIGVDILGPDSEDMFFVKTSQKPFWASVAKWKIEDIVVKFDDLKDTKETTPKIPAK